MNTLYCSGTLIGKPFFSNKEGKKPFCVFKIMVDGKQIVEIKCFEELAIECSKYLSEGRKVFVIGSVYVKTYGATQNADAILLVKATNIEFLRKKA